MASDSGIVFITFLVYRIYHKYLDTWNPYYICSKIWTIYPVLYLKFAGWVASSEDPDETSRSAASHLVLHCLLRPVCPNTYSKYGRFFFIDLKALCKEICLKSIAFCAFWKYTCLFMVKQAPMGKPRQVFAYYRQIYTYFSFLGPVKLAVTHRW